MDWCAKEGAMDESWFDAWTRRRVGLTAGGLLASLLGWLGLDEAEAKGHHHHKRKRRKKRRERRRRNRNQNQNQNPPPGSRPDIILINVDDMRESDYLALSRTKALLADEGATYPNYFDTTPLCGPSRSSLLRGQYVHNHGVLRNSGNNGGWSAFHNSGDDESTIATWLSQANPAYRTAIVGKYLNGYNAKQDNVAPGWSEWVVPVPVAFYDYTLNVNGDSEKHGKAEVDYLTDVLADKARDIIASTPAETPLFLYFAPKAPHGPSTPAPRHIGAFANHELDQSGSFNEEDVSDKPAYIAQRDLLTRNQINSIEDRDRTRLESLLAVDEAIDGIVDALQEAGRLEAAYIFFVTDNGFLLGQHRRSGGKQVPYEEAIRMSMLVRGPDIGRGGVNEAMVANIDLAPTIAELAGAEPPGFVDGRSFVETFDGSASTRQALLIEFFAGSNADTEEAETGAMATLAAQDKAVPPYRGIRTEDWSYIEYQNAQEERELYDLHADPFQLESLHADPGHADEVQQLSAWLATLVSCSGQSCRNAENAPPA
jgi:arylsulfatase A-like enzyme